jgi:hypothetical protein
MSTIQPEQGLLMALLYRFCNINIRQTLIGKLAGGLDCSSVSVARKRLRAKMETDLSLRQKFEDIAVYLSRGRVDRLLQ